MPREDPRLRLVCFGHAGAGPGVFARWPHSLPADIEVFAVRLPGRDRRLRETPFRRWPPLLDALTEALTPELSGPFVLLGHSLGGMIAYELCCRLTASGNPPQRVLLVACRAPHVPNPLPTMHQLPEPQLVAELEGIGATPRDVLTDRRLLQLLTPMIRADLELAETWPFRPASAVTAPLVVFAGVADPIAPPASVAPWERYATGGFHFYAVPGGHFPVGRDDGALLELVAASLAGRPRKLRSDDEHHLPDR